MFTVAPFFSCVNVYINYIFRSFFIIVYMDFQIFSTVNAAIFPAIFPDFLLSPPLLPKYNRLHSVVTILLYYPVMGKYQSGLQLSGLNCFPDFSICEISTEKVSCPGCPARPFYSFYHSLSNQFYNIPDHSPTQSSGRRNYVTLNIRSFYPRLFTAMPCEVTKSHIITVF